MKNKKKIVLITILISVILIVGLISLIYFGIIKQSVLGVSNSLNYTTEWENDDSQIGNYLTEAYLNLPTDTNNFSFTVDYLIYTDRDNSGTASLDISYDVFNYATNSWENIHDKSFSIQHYNSGEKISLKGETIYNTGIPEHFYAKRTGKTSYDRYYGCLNGMSVSEAKELNAWEQGSSSYSYSCLYPEDSIVTHEYNDDNDEEWDIYYFPSLINLDSDYIQNDKALFRIGVNIGSGFAKLEENDFKIDLWSVDTAIVDTYNYLNGICNYQSKYTYQTLETDYFTKNECEYLNGLIGCYLDSQCNCTDDKYIASCDSNECTCEKKSIIDIIFPNKDEPETETGEKEINWSKIIIFGVSAIIVIFLILIVLLLTRKRRN